MRKHVEHYHLRVHTCQRGGDRTVQITFVFHARSPSIRPRVSLSQDFLKTITIAFAGHSNRQLSHQSAGRSIIPPAASKSSCIAAPQGHDGFAGVLRRSNWQETKICGRVERGAETSACSQPMQLTSPNTTVVVMSPFLFTMSCVCRICEIATVATTYWSD